MTAHQEHLMPLGQALDLARQQLQAQSPPAELGAQVAARVKSEQAAQAANQGLRPAPRWVWSGAVAFALMLVGSVVLLVLHPLGPAEPAWQARGGDRLAGFMPLVPQEDWPTGDTPAWVLNTEVRRDRLVALGLPFDPSRAGDSVQAELLVRPSGEVLAVRFLQ